MQVLRSHGGPLAEAARGLRDAITQKDPDQIPKVITFTSSIPEEGKSTIALILALVTAQSKKRVLIVDVDIRRPTLHNSLDIKRAPGLISVLNGSVDIEDAIRVDRASEMHVLPVEDTRASASDLIASSAFSELLQILRSRYDMVILDGAPVLPVSDAQTLGRLSDGLIYVVRWNYTPISAVKSGLRKLKVSDLNVTGIVLSRVKMKFNIGWGGYRYNTYKFNNPRYYTD